MDDFIGLCHSISYLNRLQSFYFVGLFDQYALSLQLLHKIANISTIPSEFGVVIDMRIEHLFGFLTPAHLVNARNITQEI